MIYSSRRAAEDTKYRIVVQVDARAFLVRDAYDPYSPFCVRRIRATLGIQTAFLPGEIEAAAKENKWSMKLEQGN